MTRVRRSTVTFDGVRNEVGCEHSQENDTHHNGRGVRAPIEKANQLKDTDNRAEYERRKKQDRQATHSVSPAYPTISIRRRERRSTGEHSPS